MLYLAVALVAVLMIALNPRETVLLLAGLAALSKYLLGVLWKSLEILDAVCTILDLIRTILEFLSLFG